MLIKYKLRINIFYFYIIQGGIHMNKVFKVIWSKTKNCYVVASEMAKSHTKSPKTGVINRALVCSVLAGLLSIGNLSTVFASVLILPYMSNNPQDTPEYHGLVLNSGGTQLTNTSRIISNPDYADFFDSLKNAVGKQYISDATLTLCTDTNNNYYISGLASFNDGTYTFYIPYQEAYDMGLRILPEFNFYRNISPFSSFAYGNGAKATEDNSIAFGTGAKAEIENSIALGTGSIANESYTLSVGSNDKKYRIVNVADGVANSDVATVGQLRSMGGGSSVHGFGVNGITEESTNYNGGGAIGADSIAIGDAKAAGTASIAMGADALTTGRNAVAIGTGATATGDGLTREEVESALANNQAIRNALNDARGAYTISKSEYERIYEIWQGQNEAYARVQHANELINGYQNEINNTLQPNADIADNNYNQAKDAYDTLYNDFANRIQQIKNIDFSLYANTSTGVVDRDAIAAALKTQTEEGTSFNMPQSFYRTYVDNYIKAEGDMRNNASIFPSVQELGSSRGVQIIKTITSNPYQPGVGMQQIHEFDYLKQVVTSEDSVGLYLRSDADTIYSSIGAAYNYVTGSNLDVAKLKYFSIVNPIGSDYGLVTGNPEWVLTDSKENWILPTSSNISDLVKNSIDSTIQDTSYTINTNMVRDDTEYANMIDTINNNTESYKNFVYDVGNGWNDNSYHKFLNALNYVKEQGFCTQEDVDNIMGYYRYSDEYLDARNDILLTMNECYHEQYLYEKYRDEGNDSEALIHLGNKERLEQEVQNKVASLPEMRQVSADVALASYTKVQKQLYKTVADWLYDDVYIPLRDTNATLKSIEEDLTGQLDELRNAMNEAEATKNAADQALHDKQQQIADTQPSQEDIEAASHAEQTATTVQQKRDKMEADYEALEQAKANLNNLESIASDGDSAIAIGGNAISTGKNSIGLGTDVLVTGEDAIGIGRNTIASGKQSIGIGANNSISKDNSIAIGTNNGITGQNSIAIGNDNIVSGNNSIAIGNTLNVSEDNVVALGGKKVSGVTDGASATDAATVGQTYELVAGSGVRIEEDGTNDIGQKKYKLSSTGGGGASYTAGNNISIEDDVVSAVGLIKYDGEDKKVATLEGGNRGTKLTNLSAGTLSKTSTDAVIGNQLWTTNQNIAGMQTNISTNTANIASLNTSVSNALESVTSISTLVDTVNTLKADKSLNNLDAAGQQVIATAAANAVQEYLANNNKIVPMNNVIMNNVVPEDWFSIDDELALKADKDSVYTKDETDSLLDTKADISYVDDQLSSKANIDDVYMKDEVDTMLGSKADADSVYTKEEADNLLDAKADKTELESKADKADLDKKADADALNIDADKWSEKLAIGEISEGNRGLVNGGTVYDAINQINHNNGLVKEQDGVIYMGIETGGNVISVYNKDGEQRVITGVATNPDDPSSAANVGYVNAIGQNVMQNLGGQISKLDDRVSKVGANAAAMASLTPAPSEGNEKWSLSAAVGNYSDSTAGAVGLFYRPSDKVMINVRGTVGSDQNMVGAGVSVNLDKGDNTGVTKAKLVQVVNQQANEINRINKEREQDKQRIAQLEAAVAELAKKK